MRSWRHSAPNSPAGCLSRTAVDRHKLAGLGPPDDRFLFARRAQIKRVDSGRSAAIQLRFILICRLVQSQRVIVIHRHRAQRYQRLQAYRACDLCAILDRLSSGMHGLVAPSATGWPRQSSRRSMKIVYDEILVTTHEAANRSSNEEDLDQNPSMALSRCSVDLHRGIHILQCGRDPDLA